MRWKHENSLPRLVVARFVQSRRPLFEQRAQGKPGADCARSAVCKKLETTHTVLTGTAETSRLSPRNGFTAYTCSPVSGVCCHRRRRDIDRQLDATVAAPGPHDF